MAHCVGKSGRRSNGVSALMALIACPALHPAGATQLDVRHGGPLIGLFGLPSPGESAALTAEETWRLDWLVQGSSHAIGETNGPEELLLDGETWRTALRLRTRFRERWEFGVEVPWLRHSGGSLDGLIDEWHALFGLPDGIRDQVPRDELRYVYRNPAGEVLDLGQSTGGVGDVRLSAGYRLRQDSSGSLSLRAAVELPTGDEDKLTGNGAADYSLGIAWERDAADSSGRWSAHVTAGVIRFGETDMPAIATRQFGSWVQAGAGWRLTPRVELLGQLQAASSPIDSGLDAWGGGLMLGLGAGIHIGRHYRLQLGFTEDIDVETSPDITFMLRLSRR